MARAMDRLEWYSKGRTDGDVCGVSRSSEVGVDLANSAGEHDNVIA